MLAWTQTGRRRCVTFGATLVCALALVKSARAAEAPDASVPDVGVNASMAEEHPDAAGGTDGGWVDGSSAQPDTPMLEAVREEDKPAFLHLLVNGMDLGDAFVIVRGMDYLIRLDDLAKAGLSPQGGKRETIEGHAAVSLQSLLPQIGFVYDEQELKLTITADPQFFKPSVLNLAPSRPEGITYSHAPSLFLNYALGLNDFQSRPYRRVNAFIESGFSMRGHLLYGSVERSDYEHRWIRMMNHLTLDLRKRMVRFVLGDTTANSDLLGGGVVMGGLGVSRAFALDPYFVFLPTQQISGTALSPATAEVYVNGQLVRRETLNPGPFNLQNVQGTSGRGEVRVVIRDAFNNQNTLASPYYLALGTLAKGFTDFSYNLGFLRLGVGRDSWRYGEPVFLLRHRGGATDWLTLGVRAEGSRFLLSGGPSAALATPVGEFALALAVSRQEEAVGTAGMVSYAYAGQPLYFLLGLRLQSDRYANLSLTPDADRQRVDVSASIALGFFKALSTSIQYSLGESRDLGWNNRVMLLISRTLTRWAYAFATVTNVYRPHQPMEFNTFAGLSFVLGERTSAGITRADHGNGSSGWGGSSQATLEQSLPVGRGLGYRVAIAQGENDLNEASLRYQGDHGRLDLDYRHAGFTPDDHGQASLTASGGIVLIGGRAYLTRAVQESFALIRVPGVAGVQGTLSNQAVGATDRKGDLLIPSLLPYHANRIGIRDQDIPLEYDIGKTELTLAPPYRGGAIATFPVRRVQSVSGTVLIEKEGESIVPKYGEIGVRTPEAQSRSPIDEEGNFYLEDVPPGSYPTEVRFEAGKCAFTLVVPPSPQALVSIGTVRCRIERKVTP